MRTARRPFLLLSILLASPACKTAEQEAAVDHGVSAVQFQDLVVPDGMKLVDRYHESHSREEAGWRFGHYVYTGPPQVDDACSHLLLRMPQHSWRVVGDDHPDAATRKLTFARGRYVADYTIHRQDGLTEMVIDYRTEIEGR